MMDNSKAALAAGVAGGYLLGRTRKAKLAFALATYLAGRRVGLNPRELAKVGLRKMRENPQLAQAGEQLRGQMVQAGRNAATTAATRPIEAVAHALHSRTEALRGEETPEKPEEPEEKEEPEEEPEEEEKPRAKAKAPKRSGDRSRTGR